MARANNNLIALSIILIIGLLGLNVYQWYTNSNLNKELNTQKTELFELEKVQTELEQDYQTAYENLEQLRGDNDQLNQLIEAQKTELKKQKDKISGLIWTKGELGKARDEIANLNAQATRYLTEIRTLKENNQALSSSVVRLEESKKMLETEVQQTKVLVQELDSSQAILVSQKEVLEGNNEELNIKVDMAESIKVNSIIVTGYDVKEDGDIKEKKKAKSVEMLRTCITTETNLVTPAGEKDFQIRFIDPSGKTVAVDNQGSGVLTEKLSGKDYRYSTSGSLSYQNTDTEACFDFKPGVPFGKGLYEVQVFNNEFMVGKGNFQLK